MSRVPRSSVLDVLPVAICFCVGGSTKINIFTTKTGFLTNQQWYNQVVLP